MHWVAALVSIRCVCEAGVNGLSWGLLFTEFSDPTMMSICCDERFSHVVLSSRVVRPSASAILLSVMGGPWVVGPLGIIYSFFMGCSDPTCAVRVLGSGGCFVTWVVQPLTCAFRVLDCATLYIRVCTVFDGLFEPGMCCS